MAVSLEIFFSIDNLWAATTKKVSWNFMGTYLLLNPSLPEPGQRENANFNFYFHASLWCLKRFYEGVKGPNKTIWGTTKRCENLN